MGTEDSTPNLMVLSTGVTSYTGTCAWFADGKVQNTTRPRTTNGNARVLALVRSRSLLVRDQFSLAANPVANAIGFNFMDGLPPEIHVVPRTPLWVPRLLPANIQKRRWQTPGKAIARCLPTSR